MEIESEPTTATAWKIKWKTVRREEIQIYFNCLFHSSGDACADGARRRAPLARASKHETTKQPRVDCAARTETNVGMFGTLIE